MITSGFASAEAAWLEPPEERFGVCGNCGCAEEDHVEDMCNTEDCQCIGYREYDVYQARWDAESEAGDTARKEARDERAN